MYTEKQVDDMLSQVEQEFEKALGSIEKNEETEQVEVIEEVQEEVIAKSEEQSEEVAEDYETVDELYASMNKGEKEAHYNSIKKAMFGETEEQSEEQPIAKSEEVQEEVEVAMAKSESEVALETENEELKKNLGNVNELLSKLFNKNKAPEGKAITNTSYIAKSEEVNEEDSGFEKMTKSEITSKLNAIDYTDLTKSDRTAINEFCLENGSKDKIKHLIIKE
tara:strand:- start:1405 stop:2070 length:666 start_codon:yes stop_codon:yes gene_type:complete